MRADPRGLAPGLHSAEVVATQRGAEWRGPLFRLPVTATVPLVLPAAPFGDSTARHTGLTFAPGEVKRFFLAVPEGELHSMHLYYLLLICL